MIVLAIGAHFDDVELGCGGSLLKHSLNGDEVHILIISKSDYQDLSGKGRSHKDARKEGKKAAKMLNATLHTGDFPTLKILANDELIFYLLKKIEEIRPQRIYTHFEGDANLDHKAIGLASLIACRHVPQYLVYVPNNFIGSSQFAPNFFVNISEVFEKKMELIRVFKSENSKHGYWTALIESKSTQLGLLNSIPYAEGFLCLKYLE